MQRLKRLLRDIGIVRSDDSLQSLSTETAPMYLYARLLSPTANERAESVVGRITKDAKANPLGQYQEDCRELNAAVLKQSIYLCRCNCVEDRPGLGAITI